MRLYNGITTSRTLAYLLVYFLLHLSNQQPVMNFEQLLAYFFIL